MLRAAGAKTSSIAETGLSSLAASGAAQPDVVVIDLRGQRVLPPSVALMRRQHPATGILIATAVLEPALLLEAMRAGVHEVIAEPFAQADVEGAIARLIGQRTAVEVGQVFGFVGA